MEKRKRFEDVLLINGGEVGVAAPGRDAKQRRVNSDCLFGRLPDETILHILRHCTLGSLARLAATCRRLSCLAIDPALWSLFYERDFPPCVQKHHEGDTNDRVHEDDDGGGVCLWRMGRAVDELSIDLYAHSARRIDALMDTTRPTAPDDDEDEGHLSDAIATLTDRRVSLTCPHHWPSVLADKGPRWAYASNLSPPRPFGPDHASVVGRIIIPKDGADGPWTYRGDLVAQLTEDAYCGGPLAKTQDDLTNDGDDNKLERVCERHIYGGVGVDGVHYLAHGSGTVVGTGSLECATGEWYAGTHEYTRAWWSDADSDNRDDDPYGERSYVHVPRDDRFVALSKRHLAVGHAATDSEDEDADNNNECGAVVDAMWLSAPIRGGGRAGFGIRDLRSTTAYMAPALDELSGSCVVRREDRSLAFVGDIADGNPVRGCFYSRSGRPVCEGTMAMDIMGYGVLRDGTFHTVDGTRFTSNHWCLYRTTPCATVLCKHMTLTLPRGDCFECDWIYDDAYEARCPRLLVRSFRSGDGHMVIKSDLGWEVAPRRRHSPHDAIDNAVQHKSWTWRAQGALCYVRPFGNDTPPLDCFIWPRIQLGASALSPSLDDALAYLDHMASSYPDWSACRAWVRLLWGIDTP
ncbi:F-box domain containing protein [Pandoravirus macleodensis]|uniref:F-box domain containing protein n=1 Tax=Pandoravirus macleodensis TaxID=2107707 RepID=A0A2U7UF01_9VIRU|nr:F-box domain containing protein [Pandoravirus macleodensis]AVK77026.1 F-box domain containing protein [Pandoravirus macleodensis]